MGSKPEASSKLAAALADRDWSEAKNWVKDASQVSRTEALDKLLLVVGRMNADAESKNGPTTHAQWKKQRKNADGTPRAIPVDDPHWDELKAVCVLAAALLAINGEKLSGRDAFAFLMAPDYAGEPRVHHKPHSEIRVRASQWITEAGGLWQVKEWELTSGRWNDVPEDACRDLARAYSKHNGLRGNVAFNWGVGLLRAGKIAACLDLLNAEARGGRLILDAKNAKTYYQSALANSARVASANPALANMRPDSWRSVLEEAEKIGLPMGAPTLASIIETALPWQPAGAPPQEATPETLAQMERDLTWVSTKFVATPEELAELLDQSVRGAREGHRRKRDAAALWLLAQGAQPSENGWSGAAKESVPILKQFVEKNLPWPNPANTLAAAAAKDSGASDSLNYLLGLRLWSAEERMQAVARAVKGLGTTSNNINALMSQGPYTPQELAHGLLAACDGSGANGRQGIRWASAADWIKEGADPKGPKSDGEPLRRALGNNNWDAAKIVADADGWGPVAETWLLTPRKKDPPQLKPWIEEARAIRDARALQKTLSSVKAQHGKEDQKALKAQARAQKASEKSGAPADKAFAEALAAPQEPAKRKSRRL